MGLIPISFDNKSGVSGITMKAVRWEFGKLGCLMGQALLRLVEFLEGLPLQEVRGCVVGRQHRGRPWLFCCFPQTAPIVEVTSDPATQGESEGCRS